MRRYQVYLMTHVAIVGCSQDVGIVKTRKALKNTENIKKEIRMKSKYDSEPETRKHIAKVGELLLLVIKEISERIVSIIN